VQGLVYQASEVASESQSYLDNLEFNPGRLAEVEERMELIAALKRKYGATIADVLALGAQAEADLEKISTSGERVAKLAADADAYLHKLGKLMLALSKKRRTAAQTLGSMVEAELGELKMEGTRFTVDFQVEETTDGVYIGDRQFAYDKTGVDRVEFMLSTNPGEPLKPMVKIASGGETARLMLALKTALTQADITPTLIFDEIDQGIGGRVGDIVGRKLWGLTTSGAHQVIVVTHLPQLAGYGDAHLHVSKRVKDGRTSTAVLALDENGRLAELAAMLGTDDEHTRRAAQSILTLATTAKAA
jgi:DNA repair protein RecN (Recombination protein N)